MKVNIIISLPVIIGFSSNGEFYSLWQKCNKCMSTDCASSEI